MIPARVNEATPVPPPAYHRVQARRGPDLHIDALTLVKALHLLALCRLAVRLAHRRCPPPLPSGPGGAPRTYSEESLLLIALLRTLWRLSCPMACLFERASLQRLSVRPLRIFCRFVFNPLHKQCTGLPFEVAGAYTINQ